MSAVCALALFGDREPDLCGERNNASQLSILNYQWFAFQNLVPLPRYGSGSRNTVFTHGAPCRRNEVSSDLSMNSAVEDTAMQSSPYHCSSLMVSPLLLPPLSRSSLCWPAFLDSSREIQFNYKICSFKFRKYLYLHWHLSPPASST